MGEILFSRQDGGGGVSRRLERVLWPGELKIPSSVSSVPLKPRIKSRCVEGSCHVWSLPGTHPCSGERAGVFVEVAARGEIWYTPMRYFISLLSSCLTHHEECDRRYVLRSYQNFC